MIFVLDWNIEETQYGVSPEMIDDAVVLHDYVGAAPEEFRDERSDFLRFTPRTRQIPSRRPMNNMIRHKTA